MTALPDPVDWTPPAPGYWMRNLRLGEWLPEPMTPLFADWLLERIDHGEQQATRDHVGTTLPFPHAAINGWYYLATPPLSPRTIATTLLQGRGRLLRFMRHAVLGPSRDPVAADRRLLAGLAQRVAPPSCCPATSGWSMRATSRSRPPRPSSWWPSSTRSAPPLASSCGRWRWWAARPGRWKAPWPASTASTSAPPSTPVSRSCWSGCPAANPTCPPTRSRASTGPTPPPASSAGRRPSHPRTATASWPPSREALTAQCLAVLGDRPQLQARFQALLAGRPALCGPPRAAGPPAHPRLAPAAPLRAPPRRDPARGAA